MAEPSQLKLLSKALLREQNAILAQWRARVDALEPNSVLAALSLGEFADHIPHFLDRLSGALTGHEHVSTERLAKQHGAHRWQHGESLGTVTEEWRLLHRVLTERLATIAEVTPAVSVDAVREANGVLVDQIHQGIAFSLAEFGTRQRLEADARMRDLEASLDERDNLETKRGRQLHEVSHDLRGSAHLIRLSCQLLKARGLDDDTVAVVERIDAASQNLHQLLEDLLELARLEAGREHASLDEFDAATLLRDLRDSASSMAEAEGLVLEARGPDTLPARGDPGKVRRIAQNLILNALKYTHAGRVEIGWASDSPRRWLFYVHDSGPGLTESSAGSLAHGLEDAAQMKKQAPSETIPHLTDYADPPATRQPRARAETTGSDVVERHGEGVGLAIVRQLCELLDGVLEVESEPDRGAIFRVLLPLDYPQ